MKQHLNAMPKVLTSRSAGGDEEKIESGATISECGEYRYHLWRLWDSTLPVMVFVMLNPSTADGDTDDPTIRKCVGFARREGFGGISVKNVFALRATNPRLLDTHRDPVGPENESHLLAARDVSLMTRLVVAWGNRRTSKRLAYAYKVATSICMMQMAYCLGTNKSGEPKHPLYLASSTPIVRWPKVSYPVRSGVVIGRNRRGEVSP